MVELWGGKYHSFVTKEPQHMKLIMLALSTKSKQRARLVPVQATCSNGPDKKSRD